jgi:hypothetical protein
VAVAVRVGTMGLSIPICSGTKKDGQPCKFRGRFDGKCKFHAPKDCPECPICYEAVSAKTHIKTSCNHVFHRTCLQRWSRDHNSCPLCRANIRPAPPPAPIYNPEHSYAPRTVTITVAPFTFTENGQTFQSAGSNFELDVSYLWE